MFLLDPPRLTELPALLLVFVWMLAFIGSLFAVMALPWQLGRALKPLLTGRQPEAILPMPLFAWIWMLGSLALMAGWWLTLR